MKNLLWAGLVALMALLPFEASAQIGPGGGVQQQGTVTANDCAAWVGPGVIKDSGSACGGGGGVTGGPFTVGDIVVGNGGSAIKDSSTVNPALLPTSINITPTASSLNYGFNVNQSYDGSPISSLNNCSVFSGNCINVSSDDVNVGTGAGSALEVFHLYGGTNMTGGRNTLGIFSVLTSATNAANTNRNYVAAIFDFHFQSSDGGTNLTTGALGAGFGANPQCIAQSGAVNLVGCAAGEADVALQTGSSAKLKYGWSIVSLNTDNVSGSVDDAGLAIGAETPTIGTNGFVDGILFTTSNGVYPVRSGGTLIGSRTGSVTTGVDFNSVTFSGNAWQSNNAALTGGGLLNLAAAGTTTNPTISFGTCGTNCGWYAPSSGVIGLVEGGGVIFGFSTTTVGRFSFGARVDMAGNIISNVVSVTSSNASSFLLPAFNASSTVPTLVPNQTSTTTGFGAQASGNISAIVAATEVGRFIATGLSLPTIATDSGHTDNTVCQDTTSHTLLFGSGTIGICLGTSSLRYKHDVADLDVGLSQIMGLVPVSYKLNADHGDPNKVLYGFTAEQGGQVLPKLMTEDESGRPNTFDYLGIVPVLVKAVQQQQAEIETLKGKIR